MTRIFSAFLLLAAAQVSFAQQCGNYTVEELLPRAGRVDWSHAAHGKVAFDRDRNNDGYFDLWTMSPDHPARAKCLTCALEVKAIVGLELNKGQPAWHPSGDYIVFQSEIHGSTVGSKLSNPGRGVNNVLWLTDKEGTWFVQLTLPDLDAEATGVLHPHFSSVTEDGVMLSWSEMYKPSKPLIPGQGAGSWRLKKAKFRLDPPRLEEVVTYDPVLNLSMREGFYENHGFSPDGELIIFSSNAMRDGLLDSINNDIFTFHWRSGRVTRLTETRYNEHATFFPDGRHVLWMSNRNNPDRGTDLWVMNAPRLRADDQRVTYFNVEGCPGADPNGGIIIAADSSLNATGDAAVVFVQRGLFDDGGPIFRVRFHLAPF